MKPGQKVRIAVEGKASRPRIRIVDEMKKLDGKSATISHLDEEGYYRLKEFPYSWHEDWLQPLYTDGFRIKRQGKALDKAIVERAQELGFIPTPGLRELRGGHSGGYITFSPNTFSHPHNIGYWWGKYETENLPEVTIDEFFSDDFPTYDEITQKDNVIGYIGEYAVEQSSQDIVKIAGELIHRAFIKGVLGDLETLDQMYNGTVKLQVCHQEVYIEDLELILEAWDE